MLCFEQSDICTLLGLHDIVQEWGDGVVSLLYAMLAHHGRPARRPTQSGGGPRELWKPFAGYNPHATAKLLSQRGRSWFPDMRSWTGLPCLTRRRLAHLFAGIVALADQLGSDERSVCKFEPEPDPHYIERARRIATDTVRSKGFQPYRLAGGYLPPRTSESYSTTLSRVQHSAPCLRLRSIGRC